MSDTAVIALISGVLGLVTTALTGYLTWIMASVKQQGDEAALRAKIKGEEALAKEAELMKLAKEAAAKNEAAAKEAAEKVEAVKVALEASQAAATEQAATVLRQQAETLKGVAVLTTMGNHSRRVLLETVAVAKRALAEVTKKARDSEAADIADKALADHDEGQRLADAANAPAAKASPKDPDLPGKLQG